MTTENETEDQCRSEAYKSFFNALRPTPNGMSRHDWLVASALNGAMGNRGIYKRGGLTEKTANVIVKEVIAVATMAEVILQDAERHASGNAPAEPQ